MLKVRVLGSSAGGGFPQWNCACLNCERFRNGTLKAQARTQSQVAISSDNFNWHLLNASPDIRTQIDPKAIVLSLENTGESKFLTMMVTNQMK